MTLGQSPTQADIFRSTSSYGGGRVAPDSLYALLGGAWAVPAT